MAFTHVFVIGDSLVDAGNVLELAEWYDGLPFQNLPEGAPTEDLGYFLGRFSNGYTFADLVSNKAIGLVTEPVFPYHFDDPWLGIPLDPFAGDPTGNNSNYAYGGSHIRNGTEGVPDLDEQTDALRDAVDGRIPSSALIIVTMGGNDVRDLAPTGTDPVPQAAAYTELRECAIQLQHELSQLIGDGARNICITGLADVGLIPRYDRDGDGVLNATEQMRSAAATDYSIYLDTLIRTQVVPALQALGATVTYVPLMDYVDGNGNLVAGALSEKLPLMGANVDYSATATIGGPGEVDRVTASLVAGTTYTLEMLGVSSLGTSGSLGDPTLRLIGPNGVLVGADDDRGVGFDPTLTFTASTSGNYTLELSAAGSVTGTYSLQAAVIAGTAMTTSNTYAVSSSSTVVIEGAGGIGRDVISTSVSYALSPRSEIEALQTSRPSAKTAINLTGNEFAQTLIGNTGANVLEGKGGADILYGNKGNDRFVLSNSAVTSPGAANIDAIMDYAAGDLVDVTQILAVAPGTNVASGGYLRVTTSGLVQVDLDGGGDDWITLSTINGTGAVTLRYLSGGTATDLSLARVLESSAAALADPVDKTEI